MDAGEDGTAINAASNDTTPASFVLDETPATHGADEVALNSDVEGGDESEVW
jgi:hypothetical protein